MKDKDKLILLINVDMTFLSGGLAEENDFMAATVRHFEGFFDDSVKCIFAPTRDESKPAVQAVTDFPWEGCELILQMKKYMDEDNMEEAKNCATALCEIAKMHAKEKEGTC